MSRVSQIKFSYIGINYANETFAVTLTLYVCTVKWFERATRLYLQYGYKITTFQTSHEKVNIYIRGFNNRCFSAVI